MWAKIRAWFTDNYREMFLRLSAGRINKAVVVAARSIIGWGEEGGNNRGPDIDKLRRGRKLKPWQSGAWCATAMSYVIEEAWASTQGYTCWDWVPDSRKKRIPVKRTPSASGLANRIAAAGAIVQERHLMPGDFVLWKRKGGHHIGVVVRVGEQTFTTIEGNKGRYNPRTGKGSKVREFVHEYGEPELKFFARLPR